MRILIGLLIAMFGAVSQSSTPGEADEILTQLSKIRLDKKQFYLIRDVTIRRDVLSVSFTRGVIAFLEPVKDRVTGAVFIGTGEIVAIPPDAIEKQQVYKFTGTPILNEAFETALFRFTDKTYEEIKTEISQHAEESISADDIAQFAPWDAALTERAKPLNPRLAADFAAAAPGMFFFGELKGEKKGWFDIVFDPKSPEEVSIFQLREAGATPAVDIWANFNQRSAARNREAVAHDSRWPALENVPAFSYAGKKAGPVSYHDLWLFEGLSRYLSVFDANDPKAAASRKLLDDMLDQLKPVEGAGPVWLGHRLLSSITPLGYRAVYAKGVWVIHMLRMLMKPDAFTALLQEFADTFDGKTASTWDFKRLAEKHAGQKLDWFFDEWVFATGTPTYEADSKITPADSSFIIEGKIKQSGVPEGFTMPVPVYADDEFLGTVQVGEAETEFRYQVGKKPGRVLIDPGKTILTAN